MDFDIDEIRGLLSWDLPALEPLCLKSHYHIETCELPVSCLICLPTLTTLSFKIFSLPESFGDLSLPALRFPYHGLQDS